MAWRRRNVIGGAKAAAWHQRETASSEQ